MAAGKAPIEIIKKLLFLKKEFIYYETNKRPNAKANIPEATEIINNLNTLKNFSCINNSYKSYMNVEKVLRLPNNPIDTNNTNSYG